ncbi:MAG: HlyD family efflux transporter periplasmic adaptor subunit [Candidatus Latescibacteria bacterium]|nr:HlyD family efflux transporter periplasmic adaptor subunit [Candidatus Latescibacterota bacterium]
MRPEPLDDLLRVTAPHEWAILTGLIVVLLGIVAWGLFGSVERILSVDCALVRPGERRPIVSGVAGPVVDVLANTGDTVEVGQAIARVRLPEVDRQVRIAGAKVGLLESQLENSPTAQTGEMLHIARAELLELAAVAKAGDLIISPHAGEITALGLVPGQAVAVGAEVAQVRVGDDHQLQAIAIVEPGRAQRVEIGMTGQILVETERGTQALEVEVSEVSPRPTITPEWLTVAGLPGRGQLIRLDFRKPSDSAAFRGRRGRFHIVTHRHAPVVLFMPAGSD